MINVKVRNQVVSISAKDFLSFSVYLAIFILLLSCNIGTRVLAGLQINVSPDFAWLKWCMVCATLVMSSIGTAFVMLGIIVFVNRIFNI